MFSKKSIFGLLGALLATSVVRAQVCEVLVDDFSENRRGSLPGETLIRDLNLLGGDYGKSDGASLTYAFNTGAKYVELTAGPKDNFWFAKFDAEACFDLVGPGYQAIVMDLVVPAGTTFLMTLTQKMANCSDRVPGQSDSVYVPITKYITPNGQRQIATVPFSDFATNLLGQPFDLVHLKDWTIVNVEPVGAKVQIHGIKLTRSCTGGGSSSSTGASTTTTASPTGTATASGTVTTTPSTSAGTPTSTAKPSTTSANSQPSEGPNSGAAVFGPGAAVAGVAAAAAAILM